MIVDSFEIFMKNFTAACKFNNIKISINKKLFLNLFEHNFYESLLKFTSKEKIPKVIEYLQEASLKSQNNLKVFKGTNKMLKELAKDNKLIIITSNTTKAVKEFLNIKNLNYFEEVIGADKETSKVKKIIYIKSIFKNYQYFYVGDTKGDIIEGKKAGIRTIAVTWGWHNIDKLKEQNLDYIVNSPQELINIFK